MSRGLHFDPFSSKFSENLDNCNISLNQVSLKAILKDISMEGKRAGMRRPINQFFLAFLSHADTFCTNLCFDVLF